jgi:hypothetical protein
MRKILLLYLFLFTTLITYAKDVKITVIPSSAKIYIDGNYVGDGVTTANIKKRDGFIVVKFQQEGYVTLETKVFSADKRKAVSFTMRKDSFFDNSVASGNANTFFSIEVSKDYIERAGNNKDASIFAWKMLHQIVLNYFDGIEVSDQLSGFIQTPWAYKTFADAGFQVRTRVTIKESNIGGSLTYKVKVSSEVGSVNASHIDESFQESNRLLKEYEPMISEFQSRLSKL